MQLSENFATIFSGDSDSDHEDAEDAEPTWRKTYASSKSIDRSPHPQHDANGTTGSGSIHEMFEPPSTNYFYNDVSLPPSFSGMRWAQTFADSQRVEQPSPPVPVPPPAGFSRPRLALRGPRSLVGLASAENGLIRAPRSLIGLSRSRAPAPESKKPSQPPVPLVQAPARSTTPPTHSTVSVTPALKQNGGDLPKPEKEFIEVSPSPPNTKTASVPPRKESLLGQAPPRQSLLGSAPPQPEPCSPPPPRGKRPLLGSPRPVPLLDIPIPDHYQDIAFEDSTPECYKDRPWVRVGGFEPAPQVRRRYRHRWKLPPKEWLEGAPKDDKSEWFHVRSVHYKLLKKKQLERKRRKRFNH